MYQFHSSFKSLPYSHDADLFIASKNFQSIFKRGYLYWLLCDEDKKRSSIDKIDGKSIANLL